MMRLSFFLLILSLVNPLHLPYTIRLIHTSSDARKEFKVVSGFLTHSVHLEILSQNGALSSYSPYPLEDSPDSYIL
jgi:hypothetical protein